MCGEAYVLPLAKMALWVRPDEFHQTFNFRFLDAGWEKQALFSAINESFEAFDAVGAPSTWVLNNHDVIRHVSRFGGSESVCGSALEPRQWHPGTIAADALAIGSKKCRILTEFGGKGCVLGQAKLLALIQVACAWKTKHEQGCSSCLYQAEFTVRLHRIRTNAI